MIPVSEALDKLFALVRPLEVEEVPLLQAAGCHSICPHQARRERRSGDRLSILIIEAPAMVPIVVVISGAHEQVHRVLLR